MLSPKGLILCCVPQLQTSLEKNIAKCGSVNQIAKFIRDSKTCTTGWSAGMKEQRAAPWCNSSPVAFLNQPVTNQFTPFLFLEGKGNYFINKRLIPVQLQTSTRVDNILMPQGIPK